VSEDFTTLSLRYLLDELGPGERAAFEARLEREPAAAAAFKTCADSLGRFGLERGLADSLTEEELQVGWTDLKLRLAEAAPPSGSDRTARRRWRNYLWPFAAAILLSLNLWQWLRSRPGDGTAGFGSAVTRNAGRSELPPTRVSLRPNSVLNADSAQRVGDNALHPPGAIPVKLTDPRIAADLRRLEALRREYQALQKDRDALAKEYGQIVNQLIPSGVAETGAGRLVAMELVDQASYDSGDRNGLLMKAKALLTTPGLVAVPSAGTGTSTGAPAAANNNTAPNDSPITDVGGTGPTPSSTSTVASTASGSVTGTTAIGSSESIGTLDNTAVSTSTVPITISGTGESLTVPTSGSSPSASGASSAPSAASAAAPSSSASAAPPAATESTAPYAWSVYDDTAHQGYLNLYNLPTVSSGSVLELWVMPAGSDQFQAVGQVPSQFYGQSGSLYYQLPAATATPSEVLITVEAGTGAVPKAPSGTIVLRGP
jgi:hypothetical protein